MLPLFESLVNFTDLRAFVAIALKHLRLMMLCLCLGLALGLTYLTYAPAVYFSKALIHVIVSEPIPSDAEVVFRDSNVSSVMQELNSPRLAERTAKALGISHSYASHIKLQKLSFDSERDIIVDFYPYDPSLAARWAPELVNQFLLYRDEKRFERRERMVRSFTDEMARIKEKMAEFQKTTETFLSEQMVDENKRQLAEYSQVPVRLASVNAQLHFLTTIRSRLAETNLTTAERLSLLSSTRKHVEALELGQIVPTTATTTVSSAGSAGDVIVTPGLLTSVAEPWQRLEKDQQRFRSQLQEYENIYLPGHQKIIALKDQLAKVSKELTLEQELGQNRFELEYASLQKEKEDLDKGYLFLQSLVSKNADVAREFGLIQASRLSWETMYAKLAQQLEQMDFGSDIERVSLQFMELLDCRDTTPISPPRGKTFLYSLLLGLGLAVAIPFLLEYLDDTIVFDEQVERLLSIRAIGIIPEIDHGHTTHESLNILDKQRERRLMEYFRVIRVNLVSNIHFSGPRQLIMIASSLPKEGKSVVALNLAISFAKLGENTILIDADLRRGTLHRVFDANPRPGLGQLLLDTVGTSLDQAILKTSEPNLSFLPCGRHIHSASELLESDTFGKIMQTLRSRYTRIILDTPPVLGLAETSSMVKGVDGVILVVWSGGTALKAVKTAKAMLDANGAKYFGCVLNKIDLSNATSYYYYYYYSYKYYQAYHRPEGELPAPSLDEPPTPPDQ